MRIHTRLLVLLLASVALYAAALLALRASALRVSAGVLEAQASEAGHHLEAILGLERASAAQTVFDNSFWDEMVAFVRHPDPAWAKENIEDAFPLAGIRNAWVYDTDFQQRYAMGADAATALPDIETVRAALRTDRFPHFYWRSDSGALAEFFVAPIQPSSDAERRTPPQGWLIASRPLDEKYLQRLSGAAGLPMELLSGGGPVPANRLDARAGAMELFVPLPGLRGEPVGALHARRLNPGLKVLQDAFTDYASLYLLLAAVNLVLLGVFVVVWVRNPLQRISESLDRQELAPAAPYLDAPHEFGTIARLLRTFLTQRDALLDEVEMRKRSEAELREARDLADRSARAKAEFLSVMSHELRTPLTAVIGYADLLLESQPRPDQEEQLQTLRFAGESLLALVNDILDFNRIDADKLSLEQREFNPATLVQTLLRTFRLRADDKGIGLHTALGDGLPARVVGDPLRLAQVLGNLVSNAIKFTPAGSVTVGVEAVAGDADAVRLAFRVTDTGIGIAADKQPSIFEVFTQAESDTTRRYGGSGLGLTIAQRLVGLMGGVITVESALGRGATFRFTVPFARAAAAESVSAPAGLPANLAGRAVLVVEDNAVNRQLAMRLLAAWGCAVEGAENGVVAVATAANRQFDLVLMDLHMPEMNGVEAAARIREARDGPNARTTILVFSAVSPEEAMPEADAALFDGWIAKPIRPSDLRAALERYLVA